MPPVSPDVPPASGRQLAGETPAVHGAGEGRALPKGLSLFRFILFSSLMLGGVYGGASLYFSAPPPLGDISPSGVNAATWEPSLVWFPAYLSFKLRLGVRPTIKGYMYTSQFGRAGNASATILFGMLTGGLIGWFGGEAIRRWAVRKRYE